MSGATPRSKKSKLSSTKPNPKPAPPKKSHRSAERVVESSDEETESTSVYETATTTTTEKSETESKTESESESESETETGSGSITEGASETEESQPLAKDSDVASSKYTYAPPPAFKLIPPSSSSSNPFSARNLEGKEIWFITAPLAAPLSKLTDVNPADIAEGMPVLETGSRRYCLRAQDDAEELMGVTLAVQDGKAGYKIASKKITKSFKLVEELPVPAAPSGAPKSKEVREQPEGLWMRFKPIGYVGAQDEDANVEMVDVEVRPEQEDVDEHRRKKRKSHKEGADDSEKKEKRKHKSKEKHRSKTAVEV